MDSEYLFPLQDKVPVMRYRGMVLLLVLVGTFLAGPAGAGSIDERVRQHVLSAVEDGVRPADFHHLFMAFLWRETLSDWTQAERHLDRLAGVRNLHPLMADELRLIRSRLQVDRGRDAVARELFRTMGGLESWWFLGPEPLEELADFNELVSHPAGDATWRTAAGTDPLGWVRLAGLAWPPQRQMAFLATTVVSDRDQPVAVRLGVAQVARVWLNGVEVLTTKQPLSRAEDQVSAGGWLREGRNVLVVAVGSEDDRWWLRVRLTRPDGGALVAVRESDEPPGTQIPLDSPPPEVVDLESEIRLAVDDKVPGAKMALAAFLVDRQPEPEGGSGARVACQSARSEVPGEARLLEWLVTSEQAAARELLAEAIALDESLVWARLELAGWYGGRGLYEEAQTLLVDWTEDEPAARGTSLQLDAPLWGPLTLPALSEEARRYPRCVRLNTALAETAEDGRRWHLVREAVQRLTEVTPGLPSVIDKRQRLAESCGDGRQLREIYSALLERDPNQPGVRMRLARLLQADHEPAMSRAVLDAGLERSPTDIELMLELARLENTGGNPERVVALARRVLDLRPQNQRAQRLLELLGEEAENLDWMRTEEQLWQMADTAPAGDPAVGLIDHREIFFLPSNLTEERVQRAFLITKADRANEFLGHSLPFVAESERLRVLRARILRRDGSEIQARQGDTPRLSEPEFNLFYDTRLRVLRFSEFEDGDLIEIAYILTETEEANETGPYNGGLVSLGQSVPVALTEIEIAGPQELLPDWELVQLEGEPSMEVSEDDTVHLRWQWRNLQAVPIDVPAAPRLLVMPYLVYSNHPEWGDLADWYQRHVAPRVRVTGQVEALARRLVEGHDDRLERISRIYRYVTNEIKYVGLEFGEHRFRPFSADWVLHHRIGDCKDTAALLVALFNVLDIPARMVMVRTSDLGPVPSETAALEVFNHAIAYLPEDDLWLDGTAAGHAVFPPPTMDQNAVVLVVDGPQSRLQTTPVVGGGLARVRYDLRPGADDLVDIVIRNEDTGEAADIRRSRFAGSREKQRFSRWLQRQFPGAQLTGEPKLKLVPSRDPTITELSATVTRGGLASTGGIRVYPGELGWSSTAVPGGSRSGPLMVAVRPDLEWELIVDLGRPPGELPASVDLATEFGSLKIEAEDRETGYSLKGLLHLEPGLLEADEVSAYRQFLVTVERHLERRLESP